MNDTENKVTLKKILLVEERPLHLVLWKALIDRSVFLTLLDSFTEWPRECLLYQNADILLTTSKTLQGLPLECRQIFNTLPIKIVAIGPKPEHSILKQLPISIVDEHAEYEDLLGACGVSTTRSNPTINLELKMLSAQEKQVITHLAKGASLKEIGDEIGTTVSTVQSYKERALKKLGIHHLADLAVWAAFQEIRECPCRTKPKLTKKENASD
jgi:DNA-binding CsgD family transcriptional regulator